MQLQRPLSPTFQQRMLTDPNYMAIQNQVQNGMSMAPARGGPIEAIARALTGGLAGMNMNKLQGQYQSAEDSRNKTVLDALNFGRDQPAGLQAYGDGTTINWNQGRKGNMNDVIQTRCRV